MASRTREEKVANLQSFQESDLKTLYEQLAHVDANIATVETRVADETNMLSAARGLVGMRGGHVDHTAGDTRRANSRARPRQRLWTNKEGEVVHHGEVAPVTAGLSMAPCGVIYTDFQKRFEAPRQSFTGCAGRATIVFTEEAMDGQIVDVLEGLEKGSRLWIVYWLDRNSGQWRHFVRPPRAKGGWRVGLFATRSPNRPSPIGLSLSVVEGVDVHSKRIVVSGVDILDETPLVAIRTYDPCRECHANVKSGWLDDEDRLQPLYYDPLSEKGTSLFDIVFVEEATMRLGFINDRSAIDVHGMVRESLKRLVTNSTNREGGSTSQNGVATDSLAIGAFRVVYAVDWSANTITVRNVTSGMRKAICEAEAETDPEAQLHLDFQRSFQEGERDLSHAGTDADTPE